MISDWHKKYDEALKEVSLATEEWRIAEAALARANARRNNAERELSRLYRARMDIISAHSEGTK